MVPSKGPAVSAVSDRKQEVSALLGNVNEQ